MLDPVKLTISITHHDYYSQPEASTMKALEIFFKSIRFILHVRLACMHVHMPHACLLGPVKLEL